MFGVVCREGSCIVAIGLGNDHSFPLLHCFQSPFFLFVAATRGDRGGFHPVSFKLRFFRLPEPRTENREPSTPFRTENHNELGISHSTSTHNPRHTSAHRASIRRHARVSSRCPKSPQLIRSIHTRASRSTATHPPHPRGLPRRNPRRVTIIFKWIERLITSLLR